MEAKTKKVLLISITASIATIFLAWGIWFFIYQSQFAVFKNESYGLSMKYPRGWSANKDYQGTAMMFISPKESPLDVFQENVNVAVQDLSAHPMDLKEFVDTASNQMTKVFKNISVVETRPTKVANTEAQRIVFEAKEPDQLTMMVVCFMRDNEAYTITYAARSFSYPRYYGLVRTMINSLTIN